MVKQWIGDVIPPDPYLVLQTAFHRHQVTNPDQIMFVVSMVIPHLGVGLLTSPGKQQHQQLYV